jgi:hypothetical protein
MVELAGRDLDYQKDCIGWESLDCQHASNIGINRKVWAVVVLEMNGMIETAWMV